ncbi:MAG: aminotransferase class V-fold PLP-dependent enzyme [Myxococcales bacterium]|nr:aminotransferase class V-fold PLP-dependent enzyme [Myxococcales bacterium]
MTTALWDPTGDALRQALKAIGERLGDFLDENRTAPAHPGPSLNPRELALLGAPPPTQGRPLADALDDVLRLGVPAAFNTSGPGYLAYIPGGGLPLAGLADLVADVTNRFTGLAVAAPGLVAIECSVITWMCERLGLPPGAFGILTTGGSLANLTAVIAARVARLPENFLDARVYLSADAHHSVAKACLLAGFPRSAFCTVPLGPGRRIDVDALRSHIRRDRDGGRRPFLVASAAGTTNTGAVDDLEAIADLCESEGLWNHVDAAYGGFFALTARGHQTLAGIGRADSITLDPHKGLFLPYGTGALLVRNRRTLEAAHDLGAAYLPAPETGATDFSALSSELSRDFRGLRIWLPLHVAGTAAFESALDEKLDLARYAAEFVRALPGFELVTEPVLSLFAFRLTLGDHTAPERDALNRRLLDAVNARGRVYLSGTTLECGYVLRLCVLSFRTHREHIDAGLADLVAAARELLATTGDPGP